MNVYLLERTDSLLDFEQTHSAVIIAASEKEAQRIATDAFGRKELPEIYASIWEAHATKVTEFGTATVSDAHRLGLTGPGVAHSHFVSG